VERQPAVPEIHRRNSRAEVVTNDELAFLHVARVRAPSKAERATREHEHVPACALRDERLALDP
jgi:hypothetical protein